jgi:UDP-glucose 4-epimerase
MKILVTGGAGYIGSHTVKLLLENKFQVVVIDNLFRGFRQPLEVLRKNYGLKNLAFYQVDLRNFEKVNQVFEKEKPELYFENNVCGSLNLLRAMAENQVNYLVFSSTSEVYGESQYLPLDEKHPLSPTNPYGESKMMVERMIYWFGKPKGLKSAVMRYFNVTGADSEGLIGDSKKPSQLLTQNAVRGALGISPFELTCPRVKTKDGTPIRDYINIEDLVDAHLLAFRYLKKGGKSDAFNLGTGTGYSVLEIVNQVQEITGAEFPLERGNVRKGEPAAKYANIQKAKKILGWQPKRSLKDSVESLVKWYEKHPHGWEY